MDGILLEMSLNFAVWKVQCIYTNKYVTTHGNLIEALP